MNNVHYTRFFQKFLFEWLSGEGAQSFHEILKGIRD